MKMLDLFCGEGLAAWGYWRSGCFSHIVGVDLHDFSGRYAFDFVRGDALALDYAFLLDFDFIHASPPCQAYSKITPDRSKHPRLILPVRHMLAAVGVPHVVENVEGSGAELRPNLRLRGVDFGLPLNRPRYFNVCSAAKVNLSNVAKVNLSVDAQANLSGLPAGHKLINPHGRQFVPRADLERAFGLDCVPQQQRARLTRHGIEQGIPPAMTRFIASRLFQKVRVG